MSRPNIALVVLDTLRVDKFDQHFDWLLRSGTYFTNAWSTSHWTVPAHASLFSGKYASEVATTSKNRYLNTDKTLANALSTNGYQTTGLSANPNLICDFNWDVGFDQLDCVLSDGWRENIGDEDNIALRYLLFVLRALRSEESVKTLKDAYSQKFGDRGQKNGGVEIYERLTSKSANDKGQFLFLNLMEAHSPYHPPVEYLTGKPSTVAATTAVLTEPEDPPERIRRAYDDACRYLSDIYKQIYDHLQEEYDLVITVADHGEGLGENGCWGHPWILIPEVVQVPLHIAGEGFGNGVTDSNPVNLLDVFQTVCDAADADPIEESRGVSLLDEIPEGRKLLVESHGMSDGARQKATDVGVSTETIDRYDSPRYGLVTEHGYAYQTVDGGIEGNISNADEEINKIVDSLVRHDTKQQNLKISEEVEAQLEQLGYH